MDGEYGLKNTEHMLATLYMCICIVLEMNANIVFLTTSPAYIFQSAPSQSYTPQLVLC
jgi:hypothetical protein